MSLLHILLAFDHRENGNSELVWILTPVQAAVGTKGEAIEAAGWVHPLSREAAPNHQPLTIPVPHPLHLLVSICVGFLIVPLQRGP